MKLEIGTTLNLKMNRIFVVFTALFIVCMCYVQPNKLKTIIYDESVYSDDVILPLMIETPDSVVKLICTTKISVLSDLENVYGDNEIAKDYLYNQMYLKRPVNVSLEYYNSRKDDSIYMDNDMYILFKKSKINDFINHYFRKKNGAFVLYESEEMFPVRNQKVYEGFGHNVNIGYISYLLSMYDIYLSYFWLDEDCITRISIASKVSNMSLIE
jgi:hypothetical protein